ncbi:MAG: hypothetical protein NUV77_17035 [Thermoguttaceae bacterium]|jgi:hypothetical protein|nr:hypothetical protein [Thermoguttaceae bacterium]
MPATRPTRLCLFLLPLLVAVPACVELTGQRITWSYDAATDELQILLFYDGIHDSGNDSNGKGREQIPEFVAKRNVMLLDWVGHVQWDAIRAKADDPSATSLDRDWARLALNIQVEVVGRYREPDGRVGALQRLTIPKARAFVDELNRLIDRTILEGPPGVLARMQARMVAAAKAGHAWVALEGNAIRVAVPVDSDEWTVAKAQALRELGQSVARMLGEQAQPDEKKTFDDGLRALTAAPISYLEEEGRVEFVVGRRKTPSTLRLTIRHEYEPSLEPVVAQAVKTDLDAALADAMLSRPNDAPAAIRAVLAWGPPEEPIRALVAAAERGDAGRRAAALKQLAARAEAWNRAGRLPTAPIEFAVSAKTLDAWKRWYGRMRQYPLFLEDRPAATQKPKG